MRPHSVLVAILAMTSTMVFSQTPPAAASVTPTGDDTAQVQAKASREAFTLTIDGVEVPRGQFEFLLEEKTGQGREETSELRAAVRQELVTLQLLAREARKVNLHKDEKHRALVDTLENRQLAQAYFAHFAEKNVVSDDELKRTYDRIVKELGTQQYKIRQIVVSEEGKAKDLIAQLESGVSFVQLATQNANARLPRGGDMGWINVSHLTENLRAVVTALTPGQFTKAPIKSDNGWHLLAVEEIRPFTAPEFDAVRSNLELKAHQLAFDRHIKDLVDKTSIR